MQRGLRVITLQGAINKKQLMIIYFLKVKKIIGWHHNYFVFWWK